jgi:hypothetical protein
MYVRLQTKTVEREGEVAKTYRQARLDSLLLSLLKNLHPLLNNQNRMFGNDIAGPVSGLCISGANCLGRFSQALSTSWDYYIRLEERRD